MFEVSTTNYAWGRQVRGYYVDNQGRVYQYDASRSNWQPGSDADKKGS